MLALSIKDEFVKPFMAKLLKDEMFDELELKSASVQSFLRFDIKEDKAADAEGKMQIVVCAWKNIKPIMHSIIMKGGRPTALKLVFGGAQDLRDKLIPDSTGLYINIMYDVKGIMITTGTAFKTFSLDKSRDAEWDNYVIQFLNAHGIVYTNENE